jgi:hypothetical protein
MLTVNRYAIIRNALRYFLVQHDTNESIEIRVTSWQCQCTMLPTGFATEPFQGAGLRSRGPRVSGPSPDDRVSTPHSGHPIPHGVPSSSSDFPCASHVAVPAGARSSPFVVEEGHDLLLRPRLLKTGSAPCVRLRCGCGLKRDGSDRHLRVGVRPGLQRRLEPTGG